MKSWALKSWVLKRDRRLENEEKKTRYRRQGVTCMSQKTREKGIRALKKVV